MLFFLALYNLLNYYYINIVFQWKMTDQYFVNWQAHRSLRASKLIDKPIKRKHKSNAENPKALRLAVFSISRRSRQPTADQPKRIIKLNLCLNFWSRSFPSLLTSSPQTKPHDHERQPMSSKKSIIYNLTFERMYRKQVDL